MPSSIRPAQNISPEQLQAELSKRPSPPAAPPAVEEAPPERDSAVRDIQQPQEQRVQQMPNLMESIRKGVMDKKAAPEKAGEGEGEPETPPPAKETAKPAKKAISSDDAPPPPKKDNDTELTPEERGVLPHDSERTRKRILFFHGENKRLADEAAKLKAELEAAKAAPKTSANDEEIAKLREEHKRVSDEATRLRRRYDWENDSETKAKYREPIAAAEKTVEETLRRANFSDGTLKAIKDLGGFAAFSRSSATFPVNVDDPDNPGSKKTVHYTAAELARGWLNAIPVGDAEMIKQAVGRQEILQADEKAAIAKAQEEAGTYYENQTKAQREAQEQQQAALKKHNEEYVAWQTKAESETEWLKDRPVPDNAAPEERASIESYNKAQAELRESLKKHPANALEYGQLKLDAAHAKHLARELAARETRIAELEGEVRKSRSALKTTSKGGSLLVKSGDKPEPKRDPNNLDWKAAMDARMTKMAGGSDE